MLSGVYIIMNIANGHFYVGSAKNLEKRKEAHFKKLRRGVHPNAHLQAAFSKYGQGCFLFTTIEYCSTDELIKTEQKHIDQSDKEKLYNIRMIAESNLGLKASEETRKKMSESGKLRGFTEEHKRNISLAKKGCQSPIKGKPRSEETKRKIREANIGQTRSAETRAKMSAAKRKDK